MKRSPLRDTKAWLKWKGLYPGSRLGKFTVYLGLIDLVIWLVRRGIKLANPQSDFAGGWLYFLTIVLGISALIWAIRWIRRTWMWRLRNRLIVTYIFIGVAPVALLIGMFLVAGWLFVGQFAAYLVTNDFKSELHRLSAANNTLMGGAKVLVRANKFEQGAHELVDREIGSRDFPDRHVSLWFRGKGYVIQGKPDEQPIAAPESIKDGFEALVLDHGPFLRAVSRQKVGNDELVMVSSVPLTRQLLSGIARDLGYVVIYPPGEGSGTWKNPKAGNKTSKDGDGNFSVNINGSGAHVTQDASTNLRLIDAGDVPAPSHALDVNLLFTTWNFDLKLPFGTFPTFTKWSDGTTDTGALGVQTRLSRLYARLFESVGKNASMFIIVLTAIAIFLAVIELIALIIGLRLSRTITRSVAELYVATEHINKADFHHRIQIKSRDQLAALETSFNSMTASIEALIIEQKEKQKLESELAIAQEVQALLFPREINGTETLEMHGVCRPARTVSGDYYDFLQLGRNQIGLAVGDISGKGISAALLMATVHAFVRAYTIEEALEEAKVGATAIGERALLLPTSGDHLPPATLLALLNEQLYRSTPASKYATMFLGFYDGDRRRLTYSNAGHLPPFLVCADGSHRKLGDGGMVVGLFGGVSYENDHVDLCTGDIIVAYSDGVTEPENEYGEFGEERLAQIVRENSSLPLPRIADAVITAVSDWIGGAEQPDDITVVLARAR